MIINSWLRWRGGSGGIGCGRCLLRGAVKE